MMRSYAVNEATQQCAVLNGGDECSTITYDIPAGWKYQEVGDGSTMGGCPAGYQQVSLAHKTKPHWQLFCLFPIHSGSSYTFNYFWFRIVVPVVLLVIIGWLVSRKFHTAK